MKIWSAILFLASAALTAPALDQADPADVARAVLSAYGSKDLVALSRLATPENRVIMREIARDGQAHPRYRSLFGDGSWRWEGVRGWDGEIRDLRYFDFGSRIVCQVKFGAISPREVLVVSLLWADGAWWFDDVNSPDDADFQRGRKRR